MEPAVRVTEAKKQEIRTAHREDGRSAARRQERAVTQGPLSPPAQDRPDGGDSGDDAG